MKGIDWREKLARELSEDTGAAKITAECATVHAAATWAME